MEVTIFGQRQMTLLWVTTPLSSAVRIKQNKSWDGFVACCMLYVGNSTFVLILSNMIMYHTTHPKPRLIICRINLEEDLI